MAYNPANRDPVLTPIAIIARREFLLAPVGISVTMQNVLFLSQGNLFQNSPSPSLNQGCTWTSLEISKSPYFACKKMVSGPAILLLQWHMMVLHRPVYYGVLDRFIVNIKVEYVF